MADKPLQGIGRGWRPTLLKHPHRRPGLTVEPGKYSGTTGPEFEDDLNYLYLKFIGYGGIYEYNISFNPSVDSQIIKFWLIDQQPVRDIIGDVTALFDAKLYLPRKLPPVTHIVVTDNARPTDNTTVNVTIKFIKMCKLTDCRQLYNFLFRKVTDILKMTQVDRDYFDPKRSLFEPQHKLEVWPGYVTAVQEYHDSVMLNCDASFRRLRMITARDIIQEASRQDNMKDNVAKALNGAVVLTRYNNKTYRVDDIAWNMSANSKFATRDGSEISFVEYYKRTYDLVIKDVTKPLLISKAKKVMPEAEKDELICLVPEFCIMTGLTDEMRSDFKVKKHIGFHTHVTPERRQMALQKFINNIYLTPEARACFEDWNLQLDTTPVTLNGRFFSVILGDDNKIEAGLEADWGSSHTCPTHWAEHTARGAFR